MTRGSFRKIQGILSFDNRSENTFYLDYYLNDDERNICFFSWKSRNNNPYNKQGIARISFKHITNKLPKENIFTYQAPNILEEVFASEKFAELKEFLPKVKDLFSTFKIKHDGK